MANGRGKGGKTPSVWELCARIPDQKVDSKKFGEVLQVDGIPLWYLLDPFYLPKPFKSWSEVDKIVAGEMKLPRLEKSKINMLSAVLKRWLAANERLKLRIPSKKAVRIKPAKRDVLFLTYSNQVFEKNGKFDFFGFGDVFRSLEKKGVKPLVVVCDMISKPFYSFKRHPNAPDHLVYLYDYVDRGMVKESRGLSRKLNQEWKRIDKPRLFTFKGKDYWAAMKDEVNFVFSREMLSMTLTYYLALKKIIQAHDVKVVYLTGVGMHELPLLAAARKLGKRAVYASHGYGVAMESLSAMFSSDKYRDVIFLAAGEEQRRKLFSGIKDKNIVITGSPFFDKIADYRPKKAKPRAGKVVTLLPSAYVEYGYIGKDEYFSFIRKFLVQASKVKNVGKVIIKMHPLERHKSTYESIARSLGLKNVEVVQRPEKEFLYSVLRDSDLLIGAGSTANIEGLMLDKDVILVDGLAKGTQADLAKIAGYRKAAVVVDKGDDLTGIITKVLTDEKVQRKLAQKRQRYLADSFYKIDGKAHERVADLVKSLI